MKNLKTFEEFLNESKLNEAQGLEYWKDYEVDNSIQGGPSWMSKLVRTNLADVSTCIKDTIEEWDSNVETKDAKVKSGTKKIVKTLAEQFFKKFGYINGNIISAMIMQMS